MEDVGLLERAETNHNNPEKTTAERELGKTRSWRRRMEDTGSYKALSAGDEWCSPVVEGSAICSHAPPTCWRVRKAVGGRHACDGAWEISCRSSCLRWVDRLPTSRMVMISHRQ